MRHAPAAHLLLGLTLLAPAAPTRAAEPDPATTLTGALDEATRAAGDLTRDRDHATTRAAALEEELTLLRATTRPTTPPPVTIPPTTTAPVTPPPVTTSPVAPPPVTTAPASADLYVSPTGDDAAPGTVARPLRTITAAAARVRPGQVVLIAPGVYRESVRLARGGEPGKPVTFRADAPGTVVVDGADRLVGWTKQPGATDVWSVPWAHAFSVGRLVDGSPKRYFGLLPPDGFCEQLTQDGRSLRRILGPAPVAGAGGKNIASPGKGPGTFWIDYDAKRLFACPFDGKDPNAAETFAATRDQLFAARPGATARYVTVQNLSFRNACNFPQRGAVSTQTGWRLEDVTVERVAAVGVWVGGSDVTLLRVVAKDNGQAGISGSGVTNSLVKDCVTRGNNTRRFPGSWECGGGKFTRCDNLRFENHLAEANVGPGLWFDINNKTVVVTGSTFRQNVGVTETWQGVGLMVEISYGPVRVERCTFDRNTGAGVAIFETPHVTVNDNAFVGTGVNLREMGRQGYELSNATITNNRFTARTSPSITTAQGSWTPATFADKAITLERNTYEPATAALVVWGRDRYTTLEALRAGLKVEAGKGTP